MRLILFVFLILLSLSAPAAFAQTEPTPDPSLIITARFKGPAIWKLTRGEAQVYILGAMPVMVKRAQWDMGRIERIMSRADLFLTSPKARVGPIAALNLNSARSLKNNQNLEQQLSPALYQRFVARARAHGLDPKTYARARPLYAAYELRDAIYEREAITSSDPEKVLTRLAKSKGVKTRPMSTYSAAAIITKLKAFSIEEQRACVTSILNEIDYSLAHVGPMTAAWGAGDVKTVLAHETDGAVLNCLEGDSATSNMVKKAVDDAVTALNQALIRPGETVVVLPLSVLLAKDGALLRLQAQGVVITTPP
jgi:uncharacterized protein YbaP (TraB family)